MNKLWLTDDPNPKVINDVHNFLGRFVAYPSEAAHVAHTLWIAHCHAMEAWESTPRLAFLSPEPGSGKTRALEITALLVPKPIEAVNCTPAALFRLVGAGDGLPTILFDEIDTVFGPKAKENEELRGLVNAGYRRGAKTYRCVMVGKKVEVEEIEAFSAVALAGLGNLPDTILSRSVIIRMRRRAPDEQVEPFRRRIHSAAGHALRDRFASWLAPIISDLEAARPEMPDGIEDRNADICEPLLAIADAAGGDWPERARVALVALVALLRDAPQSPGLQLLEDLRSVFGEHGQMATADIIAALHELPESPWADMRGKPLDGRGLAARLRKYEIKPKGLRIGDATPRGYTRADLHEAWSRYLSPIPEISATSATAATSTTICAHCQGDGELIEATNGSGMVRLHPGCLDAFFGS